MVPDKIELTPEEVMIVLKWAGDGNDFSAPTEEVALCKRLFAFAKAHGLDD